MFNLKNDRFFTQVTSVLTVWILVLGGFVGLSMVNEEVSAAGPTEVSGLIETDTTWTSANSPYHIVGNTTLKPGMTLTIEAGTEIKFANNTVLTIRGDLKVKGTESKRVIVTAKGNLYNYSLSYIDGEGVAGKINYNGTGTNYKIYIDGGNGGTADISYAKFEYSSDLALLISGLSTKNKIINTIFSNNKNALDGGPNFIDNCIFENNYKAIDGGNFKLYNSTFNNNIYGLGGTASFISKNCSFMENTYGILSGSGNTIEYNKISKNKVGVFIMSNGLKLRKNSINNNTIGLFLENTQYAPLINYNNIFNNSQYNFQLKYSTDTNVFYNWWGTVNTTIIDQYIHDIYDDITLGEAFYKPFLTSPVNIIPQPPFANAGSDQTVNVNQTVFFDGSASYDPNGDTLTYKWDFGDGTDTDWWGGCNRTHKYSKSGSYTATLKVSDGLFTDNDTCIIKVIKAITLANSPWPMFMNNPQHTGLSEYDTSKNGGKLLWKFETEDRIGYSSPAIGPGGTVYFGSYDKYLYALNPDGTLKWKFLTNGIIQSSPAICSDGTIIVGGDYLYAIDKNGNEKWEFHADSGVHSSPAIGQDGIIYLSSGNYFYALYSDGTLKWKYEIGMIYYGSPVIDSLGTVYIGAKDYLYAFYQNGTLKWQYKTKTHLGYSSPAIDSNGIIYARSQWDGLLAIYPNGTLKWKLKSDAAVRGSPVIGPDGTVYAGGFPAGQFCAINPNGSIKWKIEINSDASTPSIGSDGTIYVGSDDYNIYAIYSNGTLKWKFQTEDGIQSSPTISSNGTIYVGSLDWYLYAIGGESVKVENQPPSANAGPDQNATVNQTVKFDGSGSYDPDDDPLTYKWNFGDGTSTDWQSNSTTTHTYERARNYTVTLTVNDGRLTAYDTCLIHVTGEGGTTGPGTKDTDGDGVIDELDDFPNDPAASKDTDLDGYPDHWNPGKSQPDSTTGLKLDDFPHDPTKWKIPDGIDSDGDGVPDSIDPNPESNIDTDGDGLSDDYENIVTMTNITNIDTDHDGFMDSIDGYPLDPTRHHKDMDLDGVEDFEDAFPNDPAASVDSDGDGYPDEWNPGMTESDSTTGLKLDKYPNDPNNRVKEPEKKKSYLTIILAIIVVIVLVTLAVIQLFVLRARKKPDGGLDINKKLIHREMLELLSSDGRGGVEMSSDEMMTLLDKKLNNKEISQETYDYILKTVIGPEMTKASGKGNLKSEVEEGKL